MADPWKQVAARTKGFMATVSTAEDPRGMFVGLSMRPPPGAVVDPVAMQRALGADEFAIDFVAFLARWGVFR